MYCVHCGAPHNNAMFWVQCGKQIGGQPENTNRTEQGSSSNGSLTINEFYRNKENNRTSKFKTKTNKKNTCKNDKNESSITVGLMKQNSLGMLQIVRGTHLPVKVDPSWNAHELKVAAFEKLSRYLKCLKERKHIEYKLVYKNGDTVKYIPGTNIEFTVKDYKEDYGVGYSRITLYLMLHIPEYDTEEELELEKELERYEVEYITTIFLIWCTP